MEGPFVPQAALLRCDAPTIQIVTQIHKGSAICHLAEDLPHDLSLGLIDCKAAILALVVPERQVAAIYFALPRIAEHPSADILGEVCRVIFCGAFQNRFQ